MRTPLEIRTEWTRARAAKRRLETEIECYRLLLEKHADEPADSPGIITWTAALQSASTRADINTGMLSALEWAMSPVTRKLLD